MTRLFIFNNASRAGGYGIGSYVRQLAEAVSSAGGYDVSLIDIWADVKDFEIKTDEGGIRRFLIPGLPSGSEDEAYQRSVYCFLSRHMDIGKEDMPVFHFNYYQHLPLALMLKGSYPDCRIVLTVHYFSWCFELNGNLRKFHNTIGGIDTMAPKWGEKPDEKALRIRQPFLMDREFLHLADDVIALSLWSMDILEKDYSVSRSKIHLIRNGVGDSGSGCIQASTSQTARNVVFVGRLDEIKGLHYLIGAFEKVADKYRDAVLLIAGDGDFHPYMEQARKICGRVIFLGKMERRELESLYRSAYVGVMPSFHEQCSYTAIEMMRFGVPVIGTDSTGLCEMLDATPELRVSIDEERFDGESFTDEISDRLDLILGNPEVRDSMSMKMRTQYLERYTVGMMAERYMYVVSQSFRRPDVISSDYHKYLDNRMMNLINRRPEIDTEFFGMGGIGVYLWWRATQLMEREEDKVRLASVLEYLVYYIDWLEETAGGEAVPEEVTAMLSDMERHGFYRPAVRRILSRQTPSEAIGTMPEPDVITTNALKICNCRI